MEAAVIEKFWNCVEKTDTCWLWTGALNNGIPTFKLNKQRFWPRQISLSLSGKEPVLSKQIKPAVCKNTICVNPIHLTCGDSDRFWTKVQKLIDPNDCWIWTGALSTDNYGIFPIVDNRHKTWIGAHVYSWELYTGHPVPKGLFVCHHCDHPYCVNPIHLFLGTNLDNVQDKTSKDRQAKGVNFIHAKLDDNKVREAKERYGMGESIASLAHTFSVTASTMSLAVRGITWKHIL